MVTALYVIAILGCGEGTAPCEAVRMLEPTYQSQAACAAATESALTRFGDADFPVVVAQCIARGTAPSLNAGDVAMPEGGSAEVTVSPLQP